MVARWNLRLTLRNNVPGLLALYATVLCGFNAFGSA